jgi:flagellar motility protein MotE (MotC chaperone)
MKLNFFSSLLVILLITMSAKGVVLLARIQDETKYTFVTQADSKLIETAFAKDDASNAKSEPQPQTSSDTNSKTSEKVKLGPQETLATNIPNIDTNLSQNELKVLQELSNRRSELDKTAQTLDMRENLLQATENKLDQKVQELKSLQQQVSDLMKGYDAQENAKFQSLVKIYENMKPREAAKIFDELDMPMLIQIVTRMKEVRVAPIIACMSPSKAKELSIELAKQRSLD